MSTQRVVIDYVAPTPRPELQRLPEPSWWRFVPGILLRSRRRTNFHAAKADHDRRVQEWENAGKVGQFRIVAPRANVTPGEEPGSYTISLFPDFDPTLMFGKDTPR